MRPSFSGSSGFSACTRTSKKRMPFSSCFRRETSWQRIEGRAWKQAGELCVPGMESAETGVGSSTDFIQRSNFGEEWMDSREMFARKMPVYLCGGSRINVVTFCDPFFGGGVVILYI